LVGLLLLGLNLLLTAAAHAQISYRSATTASTTSASSLSINKPLGTVANDVLIASIAVRPNTISISAPGSSSITQVGVGPTKGEDSGSVTAELPTGIAIGDLMICLVESHDNVSHSTSTSGWAKMYELSSGNNHTASLFWKVATSSSETNPVISHSNGSSIVTRCIAYRGVNTTTPFDTTPVYAADSSNKNDATSVSTGTLTTATNGVKLLFAAHIANNPSNLSVTTGGGLTWSRAFLGTHNQSGDIDTAVGLFDADQATAGSAGAYIASYNQPGRSHGVLLALRPASSSGSNNWTLIRSDTASNGNMGTLATYYKIAGTSEPSSYTFSFSGATTGAVASILAFSGVDTTTPIDQQNGKTTRDSLNHTAPSVTATSNGDMLVTTHAYASSRRWTPPSGMTERVDAASASSAGGIALEVNTEPQATAGTTGDRTATADGDKDTGAAHFLALRPSISLVAEYHFDELSWNGTANEVTDSSVNVYSGTAASLAATKPTTADAYPANPNNPGTCRYGIFNRTNKDYVALPASFPNLGANGNAFTITAWIKTTNNTQPGQRIFIDDENNTGGFGFSLGDGGVGRMRFYSRGTPSRLILDTAEVITNNTWYFVAAVADVPNKIKRIYVYNTAGTQLPSVNTTPWTETSFGSDSGIASIGGETNAAGENTNSFGFSGNIDEVSVFGSALSQSAIESVLALTHPCTASSIDHIRIEHDGDGLTCMPETVTVKACADPACATLYTGSTTVTLSGSGWTANPITFTSGSGTADLSITTPQTVTLGTSTVIPLPSHATNCYIGTTADCSLVFTDAGFIFSGSAGGAEATIPSQIAGTSSGTYYLRAVKKNYTTMACEAALSGATTVNFAYECNDPATCYAADLMSVNGGSATTIARNNNGSVSSYTSVNMTFDANGNAPFTFNYGDAGKVTLHAQKAVNSVTLTGASNAFVVKPYDFGVIPCASSIVGNCTTAPADPGLLGGGSIFAKAGAAFKTTVTARTATGTATPSFGLGSNNTTETVSLTHTRVAPTGVGTADGTLGGTTSIPRNSFTDGIATVSNLNWSEAGVITLTATNNTFLGNALTTTGTTGNLGRFIPDHFAITAGSVTEGCDPGNFTYFGQDGFSTSFTLIAQNTANATTQNYTGNFAKFDLTAWNNYNFTAAWLPAVPSPASTLLASATAPTGNWSNGTASVIAKHQASRPASPVAPANITISAKPTDTDAVTMTSAVVQAAATPLHYGRLRLPNAYGPETEAVIMPARLEYYNGSAFALNTQDSCTNPGGIATYRLDNNLEVNQIDGTIKINGNASTTLTVGAISAGIINLTFSPPGAGKTGYADVTALITTPLPWLLYEWDGLNNDYNENPSARVNFGIYRGNDRIINWREIIR